MRLSAYLKAAALASILTSPALAEVVTVAGQARFTGGAAYMEDHCGWRFTEEALATVIWVENNFNVAFEEGWLTTEKFYAQLDVSQKLELCGHFKKRLDEGNHLK